MRIDVLTLFPDMFKGVLEESILKRAIEEGKVTINLVNFREFTTLAHGQVDDTPFGGGAGMVLMCDPIVRALESLDYKNAHVVLLTPQGKPYNEEVAISYKKYDHLILICGHYEGFDERILNFVDEEVSLGDFVLTGGEIPAMAIIDSVTRLLPGVITDESIVDESFNDNLLDYSTYTKPRDYRGYLVPDVLLSGNHKLINEWRKESRISNTKKKRPDLLDK